MARVAVKARWNAHLYRRLRKGLKALLQESCLLCGDRGADDLPLCPGCLHDLPWLQHACPRCAQPLAGSADACSRCFYLEPPFERVFAPLLYTAPVDLLIQRFKFYQDLPAGRLLASLLGEHVDCVGDRPELLLPIPLHRRRLRERGFNQAWELTRQLARRLRLPAAADLLLRVKATAIQHGLDEAQRRRNVRDAFALARPLPARHVALVDDVLTTGHSAAEAARQLLMAGAERVDVWVVARTP